MTILVGIYGFFGSDPGFVSRITSRPGFVNPVQSGQGFDNPVRSWYCYCPSGINHATRVVYTPKAVETLMNGK